ncbi:MAG: homoserine dehydrogenase [Dehalococcoidia bacterium]|nr:homoserine dehydrogenase [Dehalococcoidia bacterium]
MNKQIKVALLGLGIVGSGVANAIITKSEYIKKHLGVSIFIESVLVRDRSKSRNVVISNDVYVDSIDDILDNPEIDVVIEVMGGETPALDYILQSIKKGKNVVTANKEVIAKHGPEIFATANSNGVRVLFEASVAGGTPIVSPLMRDLVANDIRSIRAIINGTTNYILTKMAKEGLNYKQVLSEAQSLGYAESDPTNDVQGIDAVYKLAILSMIGFRSTINVDDIYTEGITELESNDFKYASELGYDIKLLAMSELNNAGITARVHPVFIEQNEMLANVDGVLNAVEIETDLTDKVLFHGPGAGSNPTTSAIMADIFTISRNLIDNIPMIDPLRFIETRKLVSINELISKYYMRIEAKNQPGVLGIIASILGKYEISISSFIQKEAIDGDKYAELVIMTHEAKEEFINKATLDIKDLDTVKDINNIIRVIG